jgi:hypothetical protein
MEQHLMRVCRYTDPMKGHITASNRIPARSNAAVAGRESPDAGLERIKHFQEQLTHAPVNSRQRRELTEAIRIEADAYRKSLDTEQATATHDPHRPTVRSNGRAAY